MSYFLSKGYGDTFIQNTEISGAAIGYLLVCGFLELKQDYATEYYMEEYRRTTLLLSERETALELLRLFYEKYVARGIKIIGEVTIHETAKIGNYTILCDMSTIMGSVGNNTVIDYGAYIYENARVGNGCHIGFGCTVGSESSIGNNTVICDRTKIGIGCIVGNNCCIGRESHISDGIVIPDNTRLGDNYRE